MTREEKAIRALVVSRAMKPVIAKRISLAKILKAQNKTK